MLIEAWNNLPFKNPEIEERIDEYCKMLIKIQEIIQRIIGKFDKYVEKLAVLQTRFKEEFEEARWVRNYPDLYFLHGVKTKEGEFWGHNKRTKFSNSLDALEYNIIEKPELAYSRSRNPQAHWFVVGLRAIDGEITVADTATKALESGERTAVEERETFITDPITKEVVLIKYNFGGQGKDITKKNIINYPDLDYISGQNEVSIKNPVFDGIWIDFIDLLIEQGVHRFTASDYGLNSKEQLIKGCQTLAKRHRLKLYAIYFSNIEEVDPDDNARIKEIIAETRKKLNAKGVY
jgi:ribosomal protein L20A (L18A)